MAKIKTTKNGNIQITISPEQAYAIRDIVARTSYNTRKEACYVLHEDWTRSQDDNLSVVFNLIDDFIGEY